MKFQAIVWCRWIHQPEIVVKGDDAHGGREGRHNCQVDHISPKNSSSERENSCHHVVGLQYTGTESEAFSSFIAAAKDYRVLNTQSDSDSHEVKYCTICTIFKSQTRPRQWSEILYDLYDSQIPLYGTRTKMGFELRTSTGSGVWLLIKTRPRCFKNGFAEWHSSRKWNKFLNFECAI